MQKLVDKLRDKLCYVWEWFKMILLWCLIIGGIVLVSVLEYLVIMV